MSIFSKKAAKHQAKAPNNRPQDYKDYNKLQDSWVSEKSDGPQFIEYLGDCAFHSWNVKREINPWELSIIYYRIYAEGMRVDNVLKARGLL